MPLRIDRRISAPSYLAIDLGASSGRVVLGVLEGSMMRLEELHRFQTPLVERAGHLYWDIDAIWSEVLTGLAHAARRAPLLRSISVDSWAVDYVPLDVEGQPLRQPYAYRDSRTKGRLDEAVRQIGADELYARTGIQFLPFNTLSQVMADLTLEPDLVARTTQRLTIADYMLFRLGGECGIERTMASTTQLYDVAGGEWAQDVMRAIGDDPARWPRVVVPGTVVGRLRSDASDASFAERPWVVATCSHDTAAAVAAAPAAAEPWAYISSGTWSLVGAELHAPILTSAARRAGFTNEVGLDDTIRFLKNRTGMWVLEECVRDWAASGQRPSYDTLMAEAAAAEAPATVLDLDVPEFAERGGMEAKLLAACAGQGMAAPSSRGSIVRLVLESLAAGYARTLGELETLTGQQAAVVHILGGGARNNLLNRLTARACGRRVIAGPAEATTLGNLLIQARALGDLPAGVSVRDAARASSRLTEYTPSRAETGRTADASFPVF